jgi:hypothetical protein
VQIVYWWSCFLSHCNKMRIFLFTTIETPFVKSLVPVGTVISEKIIFAYWPIRNKNTSFLSDNNEMRIFCRGTYICHFCKETRKYVSAMFIYQIKAKWGTFVQDLLNIIPVKFGSNWRSSFEGKDWNVKCLRIRLTEDRR